MSGSAGWSGYAAMTELSEHRCRLRQPDGRGGTVEVEIEFPEDYTPELRERIIQELLSGLTRLIPQG
jgi:hypothetical protein